MSFIKHISVVFVCLFTVISCKEAEPGADHQDQLIGNLKEKYSEIGVDIKTLDRSDQIFNANWLITTNQCDLIIVDNADKTIKLVKSNGDVISEAGGEGDGPGEFRSLINPHYGPDDRLYIIDGDLFRISEFIIDNGELVFVNSTPFKYPPNYHLQSIFVDEDDRFGVFSNFESYFEPDNEYFLYRLNDKFEIVERLLEVQGNKRPKYEFPEFTMYLDNIFAERSYWSFSKDWFYFIRSHQSNIKAYNLQSGQLKYIDLELGKRENVGGKLTKFIKEEFGSLNHEVDEDQYWKVLEDSDYLPIFWGLYAKDNVLLLPMFFPSIENGLSLYIDQKTEDVKFFKIPHGLDRMSVCDQTVYGIDYITDTGERDILSIELNQ